MGHIQEKIAQLMALAQGLRLVAKRRKATGIGSRYQNRDKNN